ncbi:MAG: glycosyltransferase [Candidatus Rokuibacteriota bacterium]
MNPRSAPADPPASLSVVIPCFNEERTLARCLERLLAITDDTLSIEIVIVDDCSTDRSLTVARELATKYPNVRVLEHDRNRGKGAALRTGFGSVRGELVAVQDADLEYDPMDLKRLIEPLRRGEADVVLGSRFLSGGSRRVLYFWHYVANRFLTLLSNMFTDLNLSDMETGYKVFRREVLQALRLEENRFGIEPELVAKIAHRRLRIFEMGISYSGRTYEEGKKIGARDAVRALYCILRYNAHSAPVPMQFLVYLVIGGTSALVNILAFIGLYASGLPLTGAVLTAFALAAAVNYVLCIVFLFRHRARWTSAMEALVYVALAAVAGLADLGITRGLVATGLSPIVAKALGASLGVFLNFAGRRFLVFPERGRGPWAPQVPPRDED